MGRQSKVSRILWSTLRIVLEIVAHIYTYQGSVHDWISRVVIALLKDKNYGMELDDYRS